jgi:SAM-dependent methyltransferase
MKSDPADLGSRDGPRGPERTRFADPPRGNGPDAEEASDWSQPILFQPAQPDPVVAAEPVAPQTAWEPRNHPERPIGLTSARARPTGRTYDVGTSPKGHQQIVERAADVAASAMPMPLRLLDVGCGAGELLNEMIVRVPYADVYVGLDPVAAVIADARRYTDLRVTLVRGEAEALPFADASFDLVLAAMTFGYWADQRAGARELARVVADTGKVVLIDAGESARRRGGARNVKDVTDTLEMAGLHLERTEILRRSTTGRALVRALVAAP